VNKYLFLSLLALFLSACGSLPTLSNQVSSPTPVQETATSATEIKTPSPSEEVDQYTRELHRRIRNCVDFRNDYDFTFEGEIIDHSLGTSKVRECIDLVLELNPPADCEGCEDLSSLVEQFSNQTLESMDFIDEGYEKQKPVFISEGLVTFWDADLIWEMIKLTINRIRIEQDLPEIK
jgi:hypothetical protein